MYTYSNQPPTPKGNSMIIMAGSPEDTAQHGREMNSLGWDMTFASNTMKAIAESSDGQYGKSIDTLREEIDDSYVMLNKAGELYRNVGRAIYVYGDEVVPIKAAADAAVESGEDLWAAYLALPGDKDGRSYGLVFNKKPDAGSDEEAEHEAEDAAKKAAYEAWEEQAKIFDAQYDSWESAWDEAEQKVREEFNDELKDGFWEALENFRNFLSWAGLIVGILALVIGGPIFAALAAAIAVLSLVVVTIQLFNDDYRSWGNFFWAVVGVIPVGKVGHLFQKGNRGEFFKAMANNFKPSTYSDGIKAMKNFKELGFQGNKGLDAFSNILTGKNLESWGDALWKHTNSGGFLFELGHSTLSNGFKIQGWYNTINNAVTGQDNTSWKDSNPVFKFIF